MATGTLSTEDKAELVASLGAQPEGQGEEEEELDGTEGEGSDTLGEEVESTPDGDGGETTPKEDVPTAWFGLDLSDIEPDKRQEIIDRFKESDANYTRLSQKLKQQEAAKPPEATPQGGEEAPAPTQLSDEDLLAAIGVDENDPLFDVKKEIAGPLLRLNLKLAERIDEMSADSEVSEFKDYFENRMNEVETQYGKLSDFSPELTRDDVLDVMAREGLRDPLDAYMRVVAPARKFVEDAAQQARAEAKERAKKNISTKRPQRTTGGTEKPEAGLTAREAAIAAVRDVMGVTVE